MMEIDSFKKAYDLWSSFKEEILFKNRFFTNHKVLESIKDFAEKNLKQINEETILYRARIYDRDAYFLDHLNDEVSNAELDDIEKLVMAKYKTDISLRQKSGFWGFNSEDSFVPISNNIISDGRTNPSYIKYLYTAEDAYTALVEVRPFLNSKVSVAEIKVNDLLEVADFSYESIRNFEGFEQNLIYLIMRDFSTPSNSEKKDYIPIQYIAEYIKTLGFDGIRFNSSLHGRGRNITIFNYKKCTPIGSKLYEIKDICFEAKALAPKDEDGLIHWKLEPYKEKDIKSLYLRMMQK